jgi:hydroxyacylglutathione hydrolase
MRSICDDLFETEPERSGDGPTTHAYLWTPASGPNVLFYNVGTGAELEAIEHRGGIAHQYLSHQDEISGMLTTIAERFGADLTASSREADVVAAVRQPDTTFDSRHVDSNGVEVIPTPGHTPGSACFVVDGSEGCYLFTGDTLLLGTDSRWFAGYIPSVSNHDELVESLGVLSELSPDVVISSAFVGEHGAHRIERPWPECVQEAIDSL